uniref:Uncharacterized protein n=1 Tax=Trachelomonas grandis TaxID=215769 RepID=A0A385UJI1_9EUGL|nr:hypothetical protein [Trachelomonas grandis]
MLIIIQFAFLVFFLKIYLLLTFFMIRIILTYFFIIGLNFLNSNLIQLSFLAISGSASDNEAELLKKKKSLLIQEGYNIYMSRTKPENRSSAIKVSLNWSKLFSDSVINVNKKHPELANVNFFYKPLSFKTAVYRYRNDLLNSKLEVKETTDLPIINKKNSIMRTPQDKLDLEMHMYMARDLWVDALERNSASIQTFLRSNDIILAIGSMLPKFYEKNFIIWPTVGYLSFTWAEFLKCLKMVRNSKGFRKLEKQEAQADFFSMLLTAKSNDDGILRSIAPNWKVIFSDSISLQNQTGEVLLSNDVIVNIKFGNVGKNGHFKRRLVYLTSMLEKEIKSRGLVPKNVSVMLIIRDIKAVLFYMKFLSFGSKGFTYEALYLPLKELSTLISLSGIYENRGFKKIFKRLMIIKTVFEGLKYGKLLFPTDLKSTSIIFIEVNQQVLNTDRFDSLGNWPQSSLIDLYYERQQVYLNYHDIYNRLLQSINSDHKINRMNILTKTFPINLLDSEIESTYKNQVLDISGKIKITRSAVYSRLSEVKSDKKLTDMTLQAVSSAVTTLRASLKIVEVNLKSIPSLSITRAQILNEPLALLYSNLIQIPFLNSLNQFFPTIEWLFIQDAELGSLFLNFFSEKLSCEIKFAESNSTNMDISYLTWLRKDPFFSGIFPAGYYFTYNKFTRNKEILYDFTRNMTRLEEIRKTFQSQYDSYCSSGSIIGLKRTFRKSFQANLAKLMGLIALDFDAKGLHANLVLAFLGIKGKVDWDSINQKLINYVRIHYKFYKEGLLAKLGVNRDSIKEHLLSIINGRSINVPYSVPFPEAFKPQYMISPSKAKLNKRKLKVEVESKYNYLINVIVRNFFTFECKLVAYALQFREIVKNMEFFMGSPFPNNFTLSKKVNYILQSFESLLTISLVIDIVNCQIILHSVERDGIVCFATAKQLSQLSFKNFEIINNNLFSGGIEISCKYLTMVGETPPIFHVQNKADIDKVSISQPFASTSIVSVEDSYPDSNNYPEPDYWYDPSQPSTDEDYEKMFEDNN